MENRSDFLVLGGGMIGSSAAYYLSRAGASVTVLERGDTAFGTAGASGGLVNWITCAESQMDLFMRSQALLEHLPEELDADFELNYNSYNMQIISNEIEWEASAQLVKDFKLPGFEAHLIDSRESHELEPSVTDDMLGSIYVPRVHYLNPIKFALAFRNAATRLGARFVNASPVTGLIFDGRLLCRHGNKLHRRLVRDRVQNGRGKRPHPPDKGRVRHHGAHKALLQHHDKQRPVPDHSPAPRALPGQRDKVQPRLLGRADQHRLVHNPRHARDGLRP